MALTSTVRCEECCASEKNTNCYEVIGWSANPVGTPGCATTANLSISKRFLTLPTGGGPGPEDVKRAMGGTFNVDCSSEPSGFCQDRGSSGAYPWESAVFESSTSTSVGGNYNFLFEDCQLGAADLRIIVSTRFVGSCYLPAGVECNEDCKDENA